MASLSHRQYSSHERIIIRPLPSSRPSSPTNQLSRVNTTQHLHGPSYYLGNSQREPIQQPSYIRWMKEPSFEIGTSSMYSHSNSPSKSTTSHFVSQNFGVPFSNGGNRGYDSVSISSNQSSNSVSGLESRRLAPKGTPSFPNVYNGPSGTINPSFTRYKPISAKEVTRSPEKSLLLGSFVQTSTNYIQHGDYPSREGSPVNVKSPESHRGSFSTYFAQPGTPLLRPSVPQEEQNYPPNLSTESIRINSLSRPSSPLPQMSGAPRIFAGGESPLISPQKIVPSALQEYLGRGCVDSSPEQTPKARPASPFYSPLRKVFSVSLLSPEGRLPAPTPAEPLMIAESPESATPAERESVVSYKTNEASASTQASSWKTTQQVRNPGFSPSRHSISSALLPTPRQLTGSAGRPSIASTRDSFVTKLGAPGTPISVKALLDRIDMSGAGRSRIVNLSGKSVYKVMYENAPVRLESSSLPLWKEFFSASIDQYRVCKQLTRGHHTKQKEKPVPSMPQLSLSRRHKYLLVLDIDETLLHAEDVQINNRIMLDNAKKKYDFECTFDNPNGTKDIYGIRLRPYAREFLEEMSRHFDLALYTASDAEYAALIARHLDPRRSLFAAVLSRDHCVRRGSASVKDLGLFGSADVLLVDNLLYSFCDHPKQGVPIRSFIADAEDRELEHLAVLLPKVYEWESVEAFVDGVLHLDQLYATLEERILVEKSSLQDLESILPQKVCQGHICQVTR